MITRRMHSIATLSLLAIAISAALASGGCATEGPVPLDGMEQRVLSARTESDHRELAVAYEQQALRDRESSERHRKLALSYAQSQGPVVTWGHTTRRGPIGPILGSTASDNAVLVGHCENLAKLYAQASSVNLELAAAHRQASAAATK